MQTIKKIYNFTDLNAWKEGHWLVLQIYKHSDTFPSQEKFGVTSQINRAVVSITCNIAEGFSRKTSKANLISIKLPAHQLPKCKTYLLSQKIWNI